MRLQMRSYDLNMGKIIEEHINGYIGRCRLTNTFNRIDQVGELCELFRCQVNGDGERRIFAMTRQSLRKKISGYNVDTQ